MVYQIGVEEIQLEDATHMQKVMVQEQSEALRTPRVYIQLRPEMLHTQKAEKQ